MLAPGWTSYHHRLRYQTYDVTSLLHEAPMPSACCWATAAFRERLGAGGRKANIYGDRLALLAQRR